MWGCSLYMVIVNVAALLAMTGGQTGWLVEEGTPHYHAGLMVGEKYAQGVWVFPRLSAGALFLLISSGGVEDAGECFFYLAEAYGFQFGPSEVAEDGFYGFDVEMFPAVAAKGYTAFDGAVEAGDEFAAKG